MKSRVWAIVVAIVSAIVGVAAFLAGRRGAGRARALLDAEREVAAREVEVARAEERAEAAQREVDDVVSKRPVVDADVTASEVVTKWRRTR